MQPKLPSAQVAWLPMAHNVPAVANTFSSVVVRCEEWGTPVELGKTELLHYGYSLEVVRGRNKMARNLRLLLRAIEEMPNEPNLIMNLGLELVRSGHLARGLEQYYEGFARCRSCRRKMFRRNCARRCSRKWRRG